MNYVICEERSLISSNMTLMYYVDSLTIVNNNANKKFNDAKINYYQQYKF